VGCNGNIRRRRRGGGGGRRRIVVPYFEPKYKYGC